MYELAAKGHYLWGVGALSGAAIGLSAYWQGNALHAPVTLWRKPATGFGNYLIVLVMTET